MSKYKRMGLLQVILMPVVCSLVGTSVRAAEVCPDVPSEQGARRKLAGEWFVKAQQLVDQKSYDEAVKAFDCSILMIEHPDTVFNAAKAAQLAGSSDAAVAYAKRYLALAPDGEVADDASKIVDELESSAVGSSEPVPSSSDAEEQVVPPSDASDAEDSQAPDASESEAAAQTPPEPGPPLNSENTAEQDASKPASKLTIAGYACLGTGGAGLVLGAVFQGLASMSWARGKDTDSYAKFQDHDEKMTQYQTGALAGFIAGGIILSTGVILVYVSRRKKSSGPKEQLEISGLGLSGRF